MTQRSPRIRFRMKKRALLRERKRRGAFWEHFLRMSLKLGREWGGMLWDKMSEQYGLPDYIILDESHELTGSALEKGTYIHKKLQAHFEGKRTE